MLALGPWEAPPQSHSAGVQARGGTPTASGCGYVLRFQLTIHAPRRFLIRVDAGLALRPPANTVGVQKRLAGRRSSALGIGAVRGRRAQVIRDGTKARGGCLPTASLPLEPVVSSSRAPRRPARAQPARRARLRPASRAAPNLHYKSSSCASESESRSTPGVVTSRGRSGWRARSGKAPSSREPVSFPLVQVPGNGLSARRDPSHTSAPQLLFLGAETASPQAMSLSRVPRG